jgi:hypothetical protein
MKRHYNSKCCGSVITLLQIRNLLFTFDADPDPDSTFHSEVDPEPTSNFFQDLDPPMLHNDLMRIRIQFPIMVQIHADPDPQHGLYLKFRTGKLPYW